MSVLAGYVFIGNTTKPTAEKYNSREMIKPSNVGRPCLQVALDMGYDVVLGVQRANPEELTCDMPVKLYDAHTYRSITAFKDNKIAYDNLNKVIRENNVEVIHCNTPVGGMVGRFCGKKNKVKKVIYTVHGFHFYKGAPLFNRTVLKWAEMLMARWTDAIITINYEDYEFAKTLKLKKNGKVYYQPGVGIDTAQYQMDPAVRENKRKELGLAEDDVMLISAGDLNENKNNTVIISALAKLQNKKIHYFLCGVGDKAEALQKQAEEAGLGENVHLLGFRRDMKELLQATDVFVMPSFREGLSRSIMEAMSSGLPCVVSKIRGNVDLVTEGKGGYLHAPTDVDAIAAAVNKLATDPAARQEIRTYNLEKVKQYDIAVVTQKIREIYAEVLKKD